MKATAEQTAMYQGLINGTVQKAHSDVIGTILSHPDIVDARAQATAAGVTLWQIIMAILPYVADVMLGLPVDWAGIYAAIMALIGGGAAQTKKP